MKEYKTKAMTIILRSDDIVQLVENKDWTGTDTLETAGEVTSIMKEVIDNQPRAILVEVPNKHSPKEILNHYQVVEVGDVARALLLNSFGAKVMGNLYLKLLGGKSNEAGRVVPTKLFTKKEEAVEWLLEEIKKSKE
jgi:hypothetical protein